MFSDKRPLRPHNESTNADTLLWKNLQVRGAKEGPFGGITLIEDKTGLIELSIRGDISTELEEDFLIARRRQEHRCISRIRLQPVRLSDDAQCSFTRGGHIPNVG
jgi:hypothetical protein